MEGKLHYGTAFGGDSVESYSRVPPIVTHWFHVTGSNIGVRYWWNMASTMPARCTHMGVDSIGHTELL